MSGIAARRAERMLMPLRALSELASSVGVERFDVWGTIVTSRFADQGRWADRRR
ncbi:hypothetical protein [Nocardia sp. NPDC057440]|uniref:hypothetical protein n=1 Tax=Nocardia sp. NPDC057440 TaxID=3346134 RepID=UPI003671295E